MKHKYFQPNNSERLYVHISNIRIIVWGFIHFKKEGLW